MTTGIRPRHWIGIETGSNQAFIFRTSKQRLQLAASNLIREVGYTWIPDAVMQACDEASEPPSVVEHVVEASGTGWLLGPPELGRRIVEIVTTRAALSGTNLDVWGVVAPRALAADRSDAGERHLDAQLLMSRQRTRRLGPIVRDQVTPFNQLCAYTGGPAITFAPEAEDGRAQPRSRPVDTLWREAARAGRNRLEDAVARHSPYYGADAVVSARDLAGSDSVSHRGWVGVIHADGNAVGSIFITLRKVYPDGAAYIAKLRELSRALESVTWDALGDAVTAVGATRASGQTGWLLPILVVGDDVTLIVDGRYAFDFAAALIDSFAQRAAAVPAFAEAIERVRAKSPTEPQRVTLAAGLVFVKPNHPFAHAVELAEQLTKSAKDLTRHHGSLDLHVLFESGVRDLDEIRHEATLRATASRPAFATYGGPFVFGDPAQDDLRARHVNKLIDLKSAIEARVADRRLIPRVDLHRLRDAVTAAPDADRMSADIAKAKAVFAAGSGTRTAAHDVVEAALPAPAHSRTSLVTALDLVDMETGVAP